MNTYLVPIYDDGKVRIKTILANSLSDAKDKLSEYLIEELDLNDDIYENILKEASKENVIVGTINDIENYEFTNSFRL